jgi:hypothetical protein
MLRDLAGPAAHLLRSALLAAGWLLAATLPAAAQAVHGTVLDDLTNQRVAEARVRMYDAGGTLVATTLSDAQGRFTLQARRAGQHLLRVDRLGYALNISPPFSLGPQEVLEIEFRLRAEGILLAPLTVLGRRSIELGRDGFERRMALGRGVFLDPAQVAALQPKQALDVFRHVDGVVVDFDESGRFVIKSMRGHQCLVVFVDNAPNPALFHTWSGNIMMSAGIGAQRGGLGGAGGNLRVAKDVPLTLSPDEAGLDLLDPRRLRGIEVYRDLREVPAELRRGLRADAVWPPNLYGGCGVALVWTHVAW